MLADLHTTRELLRSGQRHSADEMAACLHIANERICQHAFLEIHAQSAMATAQDSACGAKPLAGLAVSVKDLFDVQGQVTRAGSQVLHDAPAACHDSVAVARLRQAGASLIGRTNMVEFAFSGVGINPHFGTPANVCDASVARIPGGSSSGAAVSVASGAAFVALGSDTGGSIRIPAALNGIVGFKSTAKLVPTQGMLALSHSLDTACALTRSVRDAMLVHEILSQRPITRSDAPLGAYRLGIAQALMQEALDPTVAQAWDRTVSALAQAGARITEVALAPLQALADIQIAGGLVATESYAWHRPRLQDKAALYDPRVAQRIQRGARTTAAEYIAMLQARAQWIQDMQRAMQGFDAFLSPTVACVAPPIESVAASPEKDPAFFQLNALLLRNTSVVNMLDGCAISIPCHQPNEQPVGLMIWAPSSCDDSVLNVARQIENLLRPS